MKLFTFLYEKIKAMIVLPVFITFSGVWFPTFLFFAVLTEKISMSSYCAFTVFFFIKMMTVKNIRLHYDPRILKNNKNIIISNHINNLDWIILWVSLVTLKKDRIIFVAKKSLIFIGNIIKLISAGKTKFIFVKRELNSDYITLSRDCESLKNVENYNIVIFPEGTLKDEIYSDSLNKKRALDRNIKPMKNVLIPKTKGFDIFMSNLNGQINGVINSTIIYSSRINFCNIFSRKKCYIDVYMDYIEVPVSDYENWLVNVFYEKDRKIAQRVLSNENQLKLNITMPTKVKNIATLAIPYAIKSLFLKIKNPK